MTVTVFQSTQPKRAATDNPLDVEWMVTISIHAAQEGCDVMTGASTSAAGTFQSTQPKRAATILKFYVLMIS